jgi:hypothetical protein
MIVSLVSRHIFEAMYNFRGKKILITTKKLITYFNFGVNN